MKTWKMFIGGEWTSAVSEETEPVINPSTETQIATVAQGGAKGCRSGCRRRLRRI